MHHKITGVFVKGRQVYVDIPDIVPRTVALKEAQAIGDYLRELAAQQSTLEGFKGNWKRAKGEGEEGKETEK